MIKLLEKNLNRCHLKMNVSGPIGIKPSISILLSFTKNVRKRTVEFISLLAIFMIILAGLSLE